ncbi:hypothetical protein [Methanosarcina sp. 2.H.T.1A.8]|uniref:hypothetical protein n=1 Tax=Methanosarcina sp. 2.H.T.1A.8 TaxID=1483598 RepID=UPI00190FF315|nr:hypothetical protein [Methanosarcina sp. 2.H.T.1A.8]
MRQAIVFKNNRLINGVENPVQTTRYPAFAAQIHIRVIGQHLAVPIHIIDDSTGSSAFLCIIRTIRTRAVSNNQKFRGPGFCYFCKHSFGGVWAVEDYEGDWGF